MFIKVGHDIFISANRIFVTEFRAALFKSLKSRHASHDVIMEDVGDFEKLREHCFLTRKFEKKKDNILMPSSKTDPDKALDTGCCQANVVFASGIWLDFENGDSSPQALSKLLPNTRMTEYSLFNSTKAAPRFRVYIPTDGIINVQQYQASVDAILNTLRAAGYKDKKSNTGSKRHGLDLSKRYANDVFYLPCQPKDPSGAYFKVFKRKPRKPLIIQEWIEKYIAEEKATTTFIETPLEQTEFGSQETSPFIPHEGPGVDQEAVDKACSGWQQCPPGKGNDGFFTLGLKLASAGCVQSAITMILREQPQHGRSPDDRIRQVLSILQSLVDYNRKDGSKNITLNPDDYDVLNIDC